MGPAIFASSFAGYLPRSTSRKRRRGTWDPVCGPAANSSATSVGWRQRPFAIVKHDGEDLRQEASGEKLPAVDEGLAEQRDVGEQAQRHKALDLGLELQQEVEWAALGPAEAPEHVSLACAGAGPDEDREDLAHI
jgi:hypothetical protein